MFHFRGNVFSLRTVKIGDRRAGQIGGPCSVRNHTHGNPQQAWSKTAWFPDFYKGSSSCTKIRSSRTWFHVLRLCQYHKIIKYNNNNDIYQSRYPPSYIGHPLRPIISQRPHTVGVSAPFDASCSDCLFPKRLYAIHTRHNFSFVGGSAIFWRTWAGEGGRLRSCTATARERRERGLVPGPCDNDC